MDEKLDTHTKALRINLDPRIYGTFAEIGAGQEVARWFLQAGGASGTVAKTISAYDMAFSDALYGKGSRYVSRERVVAMLDHEYRLLLERLDGSHGADTRFFTFADTVAARNYAGTNECHGWVGLRFQAVPRGEPNDILLHVNMLDPTNLDQQRALGLLGVNLVDAAYFRRESVEELMGALQEELSLDRIEIDVLDVRGPDFGEVDRMDVALQLVDGGFARALLLEENGTVIQPSSVLRKRPIAVGRGLFGSRLLAIQQEMLAAAGAYLRSEIASKRDPLALPELSVLPVRDRPVPDMDDTPDRLQRALGLGLPVLLTRFPEAYHLTAYLRRYTTEPLRFVFGASTLVRMMHEAQYSDLIGGRLEGFARLLADNVKLYVYPMQIGAFRRVLGEAGIDAGEIDTPEEWVTAQSIRLAPPTGHLFEYLRSSGWIIGLPLPTGSA